MQTLTALTFALAIAQAPVAPLCDGPARPLGPSRDLYCIELIAAPRIVGASGRVELNIRPGPFTVDVTASGVLRFSPAITLEGLPAPASLGPYSTYVAWVATPVMDAVHRLGEVRNGRAQLPAIALDKFIILVTAESWANVTSPSGRFVLRGASPSTRLQPADLMQFRIGATHEPESQTLQHQHMAPNAPGDMGEPEIAAFLTHLATERHVSASTQNQGAAPGFVRYCFFRGRSVRECYSRPAV